MFLPVIFLPRQLSPPPAGQPNRVLCIQEVVALSNQMSSFQPMTGGSLKSEPGFSPAINASWVGRGADYIHVDPSGKHMRLNAHGVVK